MHAHAFALLRAIHIVAASLWFGAATFSAFYLVPSIIAAGPAGGVVMREMAQVRRMPVFMNTIMTVALVSGLWLLWVDSGGLRAAWIGSPLGMTFILGALCALVVAAIGHVVSVPAVRTMGQLGAAIAAQGGPPAPEQAAEMRSLQLKLLRAARLGSALLALAAIAMAVGKYL